MISISQVSSFCLALAACNNIFWTPGVWATFHIRKTRINVSNAFKDSHHKKKCRWQKNKSGLNKMFDTKKQGGTYPYKHRHEKRCEPVNLVHAQSWQNMWTFWIKTMNHQNVTNKSRMYPKYQENNKSVPRKVEFVHNFPMKISIYSLQRKPPTLEKCGHFFNFKSGWWVWWGDESRMEMMFLLFQNSN
jgi:hypothetical protein